MRNNPSKRNAFIAVSVFFALLAIVFLLWGGWMAGWDIVGWFTTTQAFVLYFMVGFYLIFLAYFLITDWVKKR